MDQYRLAYSLTPGSVISIRYPLYKHFAIVGDCFVDGKPNLIALSHRAGCVQEESWKIVVGKRTVEASKIQGNLPSSIVLKRARNFINSDIKYNLLVFNCEHFVRLVHGLPIKSKQVQRTVYGALLGTASCILLPKLTLARVAILISIGAITSLKTVLHKI